MSLSLSTLGRGPAIFTINGGTFFVRDSMLPKHAPVWEPVGCTAFGHIDKFKKDLIITNNFMLFGNWSQLSCLFPAALLNPVPGSPLNTSANNPLVITAKNGDQITYPQSQITKMANLYLGLDSEIFAATIEVTSLLSNLGGVLLTPETAGAYFTRAIGVMYDASSFALTNFLKTRWSAGWAGKTGLTSFQSQKGFNVAWNLDLKPDSIDGYGTVNFYIGEAGLIAALKCIPLGPTMAQIDAVQPGLGANGALLGAGAADLTLTGAAAGSVVLKSAALVETTTAFGNEPLRVNEMAWETVRAVVAGAIGAGATVG